LKNERLYAEAHLLPPGTRRDVPNRKARQPETGSQISRMPWLLATTTIRTRLVTVTRVESGPITLSQRGELESSLPVGFSAARKKPPLETSDALDHVAHRRPLPSEPQHPEQEKQRDRHSGRQQ